MSGQRRYGTQAAKYAQAGLDRKYRLEEAARQREFQSQRDLFQADLGVYRDQLGYQQRQDLMAQQQAGFDRLGQQRLA